MTDEQKAKLTEKIEKILNERNAERGEIGKLRDDMEQAELQAQQDKYDYEHADADFQSLKSRVDAINSDVTKLKTSKENITALENKGENKLAFIEAYLAQLSLKPVQELVNTEPDALNQQLTQKWKFAEGAKRDWKKSRDDADKLKKQYTDRTAAVQTDFDAKLQDLRDANANKPAAARKPARV